MLAVAGAATGTVATIALSGGKLAVGAKGRIEFSGNVAVSATKGAVLSNAGVLIEDGATASALGADGVGPDGRGKGGLSKVLCQVVNAGTVSVVAGTLDLAGAVSGTGAISIGGGTLEIDSTLAATQKVVFGAGDGVLALTDPKAFAAPVSGFAAGDQIDLTGFTFGKSLKLGFVEKKGETILTITDGTQSAKLLLFGNYVAAGFHKQQVAGGTGTEITYTKPAAAHPDLAPGH
jgi:hypothetical protein